MKDYRRLSQIGLKARWEKKYKQTKIHIEQNHKHLLIEKARLMGFIMGDGSITSRECNFKTHHHDIRFYPDDKVLAELFINDFKKLYLKKPSIKEEANYYIIHVSSRPAWEDLQNIAHFSSLNWNIPKSFKTKEESIEWVRSLFDCEGYVGKKVIQMQSVSKAGIYKIKNILNDWGISSSICVYKRKKNTHNINYILSITSKTNLFKFSKFVGFNHLRKRLKLAKIAADVPEWLLERSRKPCPNGLLGSIPSVGV